MKKFTTTFFLLMAMVLLLPTELKAAEEMRLLTLELTDGSYDNSTSKLNFKYDAVNSRYYYDVKSFAGDLYFRIGIKGWDNDIQPSSDNASVPTSEGSTSNAEYGKKNAWKVNIPNGSDYTIYVKLGNIVGEGYNADNFRVWIAPTVVVPTTTYTLTYGGKSVTGTMSGDVCTFSNISYAAFGGTETVNFQLKSEKSGTTTYYNMPSGTTSITAATEYEAKTSTTGSDWIYTRATAPNRGNFKVTLNTINNNVALTDNTFVGTEPETGDDYYIFGDWNNWEAKDAKRFKMQPVYGQKGVYSMYINTPVNLKGSGSDKYALKFCVSSGKNIDENINADNTIKDAFWSNVFRPNGGDKTIERDNITSGEAAEQSGNAGWILKKNVRTLGSGYVNGGCYLFTIDTNTGYWTIKSLENVRVIYFLRGENDYVFNGEYLVDGTEEKNSNGTDYKRNPNNNYTGLLKMETGSYYLLSDGYHTFGSKADDISYNSQASLSNWNGNKNQPYQKIRFIRHFE